MMSCAFKYRPTQFVQVSSYLEVCRDCFGIAGGHLESPLDNPFDMRCSVCVDSPLFPDWYKSLDFVAKFGDPRVRIFAYVLHRAGLCNRDGLALP